MPRVINSHTPGAQADNHQKKSLFLYILGEQKQVQRRGANLHLLLRVGSKIVYICSSIYARTHTHTALHMHTHTPECTGVLKRSLSWWSLKASLLFYSEPLRKLKHGQALRLERSALTTWTSLWHTKLQCQPAIFATGHRLLVGLQLCFLKRCGWPWTLRCTHV